MRCLIRGAFWGALFFFCSFLHSQVDIHDHSTYHIQYDQFGNPSKVCIEVCRVVIPMIDGIPLFDQREEYICKQEYAITQNNIEEQKKHSSLEIQLPKYKEPIYYKIPEPQLRSQIQRPEGLYVSTREVPAYQDTISKMSDRELENLLVASAIRQKWLKTIPNYQDYLQFVRHEKFIEKLFKTDGLCEKAVWALWQEFQDQKLIKDNGEYKEKIKRWLQTKADQKTAKIEQELQKQIKKTKQLVQQELQNLQKEQCQKFLEQQHKAVQDLYWINNCVSDEIDQAREEALEQTELAGYMQYDQSYELDSITRGYLLHRNIAYLEYLNCHGTALQQQYHKEICDIFTQAAHQHLKIENQLKRQYQSPVLEHATNFAQAAQQTNQKNWIPVTEVLSNIGLLCVDFCKEIYNRPVDYTQAIMQGVAESAYDFAHIMLRPDKALYGLGQMLYFVLETGAMTEAAIKFPESNMAALQERHDQISSALSAMQQEFTNKDGPARVKIITKFGLDFYLPVKLTHAVGYLMGGLCSRARGMQKLEGITGLIDESLGVAEVLEETAEKIREIEIATEQGFTEKITTQFMEVDSSVAKGSKLVLKFNKKTHPHHLNKYPESENSLHHLFRPKDGHISGTVENKKMILDMVQQEKYCLGEVRGIIWYGKINEKGEQIWACVWQKSLEIRNCGINKISRLWDKDRGLNILRYSKGQNNHDK